MSKTVLITGASSGIGKETARLFLKNEFTVYAVSRRLEKMKDLQEAGARCLEMDITRDQAIKDVVSEIEAQQGGVDILVNNAGYGSYGALEDVDMTEARYQFEVNLFGAARLIQLVLPYMRTQRSGKIINISSVGGSFGEPHGSWYHSTKYALEGLSDSLRMELQQFNIDVVIIKPGAIKTEWNTIARDNLMKVSGSTAYAGLVKKHVNMLATADKAGSEPQVIAKAIYKAAIKKKPATRYTVGGGAKPIIFLRKMLSDRMFDKVFFKMLR